MVDGVCSLCTPSLIVKIWISRFTDETIQLVFVFMSACNAAIGPSGSSDALSFAAEQTKACLVSNFFAKYIL